MKKDWYAAVVMQGQETKIADAIGASARKQGLTRRVGRVLVPTEPVRLMAGHKWKVKKKTKFAGYLFCELAYSPEVRMLIHAARGFHCLLPTSDAPVPLSERETAVLLAEQRENVRAIRVGKARVLMPYVIGDEVKITHGGFAGTHGTVRDIDEPTPGAEPVVDVEIEILAREVIVQLAYWQVAAL